MVRTNSAWWIVVGGVVGVLAGAVYGPDYMIAGSLIGLAGGAGIWMVMRGVGRGRPGDDQGSAS